MFNWWVDTLWRVDPPLVFYWTFWVITSIVLHELAHGVAAIRCGDRTPIELGHMTWNPLVHMGQMSLLMFAMIGIAWGAMPVTPSRFRGRHADAMVAAAGPQVNLILCVACCLAVAMLQGTSLAAPRLIQFLELGAMLNLVLLAFNLLPVPPLDGSRILASYSRQYRLLVSHPNAQIWVFGAFIAAFYFGGQYLWTFGRSGTDWLIGLFS